MDAAAKKKKGQNELGVITKRPGNATHFPAPGCTCRVHYEARLENGDVFDSSRDRKRALIFKLGAGQLIPGLEDGIPKMSVGQICVFTVPPALGYGQEGFMPVVPPAATLTYEVELLDFVRRAPWHALPFRRVWSIAVLLLVGAAKRGFQGVARGHGPETLARATQRRRRSASLTLAHGLRGKVSNFGKLYDSRASLRGTLRRNATPRPSGSYLGQPIYARLRRRSDHVGPVPRGPLASAPPSEPSGPGEESGEPFTLNRRGYEGYATEDGVRRRNGFGTLTQGPETSEGEWVSDKLHGTGRCAFASGATYEGGFEEGVFSGEGTYKWADGASYVGGWKSGRMHGEGCYTDTDKVEEGPHNGSFFNGKAAARRCGSLRCD